MALTISCPTEVQLALRDLVPTYPPHSVEALTKAFLQSIGVTEQKVRELALAKQMPISGIVRGLVLAKHPELKPLWPKPVHSVAQIAGFAGRSRSPAAPLSEAIKHLLVFVSREEDAQTLRRAKEFLLRNGVVINEETYRFEMPPKPDTKLAK